MVVVVVVALREDVVEMSVYLCHPARPELAALWPGRRILWCPAGSIIVRMQFKGPQCQAPCSNMSPVLSAGRSGAM